MIGQILASFLTRTATTEIYTLSLHDALPIFRWRCGDRRAFVCRETGCRAGERRSEEHTSELQSRQYLVCRLLLEKKKGCQPLAPQGGWLSSDVGWAR